MITPLSHALDASPWYVPLQIINSSSFRQSTFQTLVSVPFKLDVLLFRDNLVVFSRFSELKPLVSDDSKLNAFSVCLSSGTGGCTYRQTLEMVFSHFN